MYLHQMVGHSIRWSRSILKLELVNPEAGARWIWDWGSDRANQLLGRETGAVLNGTGREAEMDMERKEEKMKKRKRRRRLRRSRWKLRTGRKMICLAIHRIDQSKCL